MKFRTLALVAALSVAGSGYALAQNNAPVGTFAGTNAHGPNGGSRAGLSTGSQTDGNATRDKLGNTGSMSNGQALDKNVSPASPDAGEKQQK